MSRARTPHDPLRGHNWRDGVEPPATQQQPVQQQQEPPEQEFDWGSADWELMHRVTRLICDHYGMRKGDTNLSRHDREARDLYMSIKRGDPIPDRYTRRYVVTAPTPEDLRAKAVKDPRNWR